MLRSRLWEALSLSHIIRTLLSVFFSLNNFTGVLELDIWTFQKYDLETQN